jgi:hypothetical protein
MFFYWNTFTIDKKIEYIIKVLYYWFYNTLIKIEIIDLVTNKPKI